VGDEEELEVALAVLVLVVDEVGEWLGSGGSVCQTGRETSSATVIRVRVQ
jgi:hypothetical protein